MLIYLEKYVCGISEATDGLSKKETTHNLREELVASIFRNDEEVKKNRGLDIEEKKEIDEKNLKLK